MNQGIDPKYSYRSPFQYCSYTAHGALPAGRQGIDGVCAPAELGLDKREKVANNGYSGYNTLNAKTY